MIPTATRILPTRARLALSRAGIIIAILLAAAVLGSRSSVFLLAGLVAAFGAAVLLVRPGLIPAILVIAALALPFEVGTGTEVKLNAAAVLVPLFLVIWLLRLFSTRNLDVAKTASNLPLFLFLAAGVLSLVIGTATWDPAVPRKANLILVQLAQWALFAFSALAFWLTANVAAEEKWLKLVTWLFITVAGAVAVLRVSPALRGVLSPHVTLAFIRAPLWVLLASLAGGQLLFNHRLRNAVRLLLLLVFVGTLAYAFGEQLEQTSNWVGIGASVGVLIWLRFPRLRWPVIILIAGLAVTGILFPTLYNFAGGDEGWASTGGSRIVLIQRVVEVTMRNPLTGLGPAAYRLYAGMKPLPYLRAYWIAPEVNSHNNYVDIFSFQGILGLALFAWFAVAFARTALKLRPSFPDGFLGGYLNSIIAAGAGSLVLMLFADWILPHVYNIGFPGFQASVLVWLFLGGVIALEQIATRHPSAAGS